MLLLDITKLKKNYTKNDIFELIKKYQKDLIYPDQDFLNIVFRNDIKILDGKYNLLAKITKFKSLDKMPLIIHYAGSVKPWDNDVSRFDKEFLEPYYKSLKLQGNRKNEKLKKLLEKHKINGYNNYKM